MAGPTFPFVLVGEDESGPAEAATRLAVELAAREPGTHLAFCYVANTALLYDRARTYGYDPEPILHDMKDEMGVILERATEAAIARGVDCEQLILEGEPLAEFLAFADERKADLIVLGSHGRRGIQRLFLGSFAEHVVRRSHSPVLVVRTASEAAPAFRHLLVPTDGSPSAAAALALAISLAKSFGGSITVLYALDIMRYALSFADPYGGYTDVTLLRDSLLASGRAVLDQAMAAVRAAGVTCDDRIDERPAWEAIDAVGPELGADVIIMGTHGREGLQRFFLGSTTERVLRSSVIPVLAVRAPQ